MESKIGQSSPWVRNCASLTQLGFSPSDNPVMAIANVLNKVVSTELDANTRRMMAGRPAEEAPAEAAEPAAGWQPAGMRTLLENQGDAPLMSHFAEAKPAHVDLMTANDPSRSARAQAQARQGGADLMTNVRPENRVSPASASARPSAPAAAPRDTATSASPEAPRPARASVPAQPARPTAVHHFGSRLDEVIASERPLTAAEVDALYDDGIRAAMERVHSASKRPSNALMEVYDELHRRGDSARGAPAEAAIEQVKARVTTRLTETCQLEYDADLKTYCGQIARF